MAPRKPQTEKRAKGLIGLKKGKKVAGAPYSVGNYKGKTLNLKKKQLTAAARKAAAVRGGRKVNISNTKYDSSTKKVLGPKGNPLTGKVDLGGGNIAVYKNGVRVRAAVAKKATSKKVGTSSGSSGTSSSASGTNSTTGASGSTGTTGTTKALTPRQQAAALRGEKAAARTGKTFASGRPGYSAQTASTIRGTGLAPSRPQRIQEGSRKTVMVNGKKMQMVYRSGRWVRAY